MNRIYVYGLCDEECAFSLSVVKGDKVIKTITKAPKNIVDDINLVALERALFYCFRTKEDTIILSSNKEALNLVSTLGNKNRLVKDIKDYLIKLNKKAKVEFRLADSDDPRIEIGRWEVINFIDKLKKNERKSRDNN